MSGKTASKIIRFSEWWDFKLPLPLSIMFALACSQGMSAEQLFGATFTLIGTGFCAAIYASIVNDFCDCRADQIAGKNKLMGMISPGLRLVLLLSSLALLAATIICLQTNILALTCFIGVILVFTCYSMPPIRLKERGFAGLAAIAVGEHVLPSLLAIALVLPQLKEPVAPFWIVAISIWSGAFGLRGIVWHQINDLQSDVLSDVQTAVREYGPTTMRHLIKTVIFPLEVLSYVSILVLTGSQYCYYSLAAYAVVEFLNYKYMKSNLIVVTPSSNERFILFEYYQLFFPVACLLTAMTYDAHFALLLALFCILFCQPISRTLKILFHIGYFRGYRTVKTRISRAESESTLTVAKLHELAQYAIERQSLG